jgi:hypothetical protein
MVRVLGESIRALTSIRGTLVGMRCRARVISFLNSTSLTRYHDNWLPVSSRRKDIIASLVLLFPVVSELTVRTWAVEPISDHMGRR